MAVRRGVARMNPSNASTLNMRKTICLFTLLAVLFAFKSSEKDFAGKIVYQSKFTDLAGNDITDRMAAYLGREQHYYINGKNYKSYDEKENLTQLYQAATNTYYAVGKDKTAQKIDAATGASGKQTVKHLEGRERIAGYDCKALQMETDAGMVVYYYSPRVKVDPKAYAKHHFGDWKAYLEATQGCLPLKQVITSTKNGFIWAMTAVVVEGMALKDKDFELPQDIRVK